MSALPHSKSEPQPVSAALAEMLSEPSRIRLNYMYPHREADLSRPPLRRRSCPRSVMVTVTGSASGSGGFSIEIANGINFGAGATLQFS